MTDYPESIGARAVREMARGGDTHPKDFIWDWAWQGFDDNIEMSALLSGGAGHAPRGGASLNFHGEPMLAGLDSSRNPMDLLRDALGEGDNAPVYPVPGGVLTQYCQQRGGTAFMIGFYSCDDPYLNYNDIAWSGTITYKTYSGYDGSCLGPLVRTDTAIISGNQTTNLDTGVTTNNLICTKTWVGGYCQNPIHSSSTAPLPDSPNPLQSTFLNAAVRTCASYSISANGNCIFISYSYDSWQTAVGTWNAAYSNNDSPTHAITRLLAGAGGTWSGWYKIGLLGTPPCNVALTNNPVNPCCLARWQALQPYNADITYQECNFKATASGLTSEAYYTQSFNVWRSPYGANTYTLFGTIDTVTMTDALGNLEIDGVVPNLEGYDTYVALP